MPLFGESLNIYWGGGEAALSHVIRNQVEPAYARSDLFERRRVLMEQWAEFLAGGDREPKAVPIR